MIRIIKGGLDPSNTARYKFISGVVSDTRLMGVVAMHLIFKDMVQEDAPLFHQFYYFDYEELGLESLKLLRSNNEEDVGRMVKECFAGLGANLVELSEKETYYLANWMKEDTVKKKQILPDEIEEIEYVFLKAQELEGSELSILNSKMTVPIKSEYGIVNYYLMRCFGKDREGAELLTFDGIDVFDPSPKDHSTFLKNKITLLPESAGQHKVYRCESLIEIEKDAKHHLVVTEVELQSRKVLACRIISDIAVSLYEASLLLAKEEYVSVFEMKEGTDAFSFAASFAKFALGMTHSGHPAGEMFMDFMPNNNHAENKVFMLSDDISGLYFAGDSGQIVCASYSLSGIIQAETKLMIGQVGEFVTLTNRYHFPASIIYDFAESGFTDFNEYLASVDD